MRVVVICESPELTAKNPDGSAAILADLGCAVSLARFDLVDLDRDELIRRPPTILLFDAGDHLDRAARALRAVTAIPALAETPRLIALSLPRLAGLDFSAGFDDFIITPLVPVELYSRLRQLDWKSATFDAGDVIKVGDLIIDVAGYEVTLAGRALSFTHQEFELLRFLAQNRGRVYTRDQLLQRVWNVQYGGGSRTVDIHVRRLRAKLGHQGERLIVTVRNVGYKMRADDDADDELNG